MTIGVITTCNKSGFDCHGSRMVETFLARWSDDFRLILYAEDFDVEPRKRLDVRELPDWFDRWKESHRQNADAHGRDRKKNRPRKPVYDFRRDCVKFAHKVAALTDAGSREEFDRLIWIDADTVAHENVDLEWIDSLAAFGPEDLIAWLDRARVYPECGFMIFNGLHSYFAEFMRRYRYVYEHNHVFNLSETHDSFVIKKIVDNCVEEKRFAVPLSLSGPARISHHPFVLSRLGERLDHLKGARKRTRRTPKQELGRKRSEKYWR